MRLLCAAAVSLSLGLFVACAGDSKPDRDTNLVNADTKSERADTLAALKKRFTEEFSDLEMQLAKAPDPGAAKGIQAEMRELVAITAEKALNITKADPQDDVSFGAAEFILRLSTKANIAGIKDVDALVELLAEHHGANPKIKELLVPAMRAGAGGDKLLAAVSEKNTDKEAKGMALFIRGYKAARSADDEDDDKALAAAVAKATDLIEKAMKEAPDAKLGNGGKTIAELGKKEIEGLKGIVIVAIGKPAPEVESLGLDGKKVKLSDYKGKVVLLDIWATWCGPCRAMIPHERELVKNMKDRPFVLVSVSADDEKETLTKFLEKEPMPWTHWWDNGGDSLVLKKYRVRAFPSLYLIDHSGVVREKWLGNPGNEKIDKAVEELVKEAVKAKG